jgi:D-serine deaminase-like pyridoxal phosphate-dependent protein
VIDTSAAVVSLERLERNLERWQAEGDRVGLANRPAVSSRTPRVALSPETMDWRTT